jgi:hypothetical protein
MGKEMNEKNEIGGGWMPIATAPKNATEVLLIAPRSSGGWPRDRRIVGHWASDLSGEEQPAYQGWFYDDGFQFRLIEPGPTHWYPIPTTAELPERVPTGD